MGRDSMERAEMSNVYQDDDSTVDARNRCQDDSLLDDSLYALFDGIPPKFLDGLFCFDGKKRTTEEIIEIAKELDKDFPRERKEFENFWQLSRLERIIKHRGKSKKLKKTTKGFGKQSQT